MADMFVVLFEENPDADPAIRTEVFPAHLAFLEQNAARIRDAGTLFHHDQSRYGGMWIVTAASHSQVVDLIHSDPFWPTGLRLHFQVLEWRKVFEDGLPL